MKMIKTTTLACIGISLILAGAAQAEQLWGVSHSLDGFWKGGQIWSMDTETNVVTVHKNYSETDFKANDQGYVAFGDIALNSRGDIYVTMSNFNGELNFKTLGKVDRSDWSLSPVLTLNDPVNALQFIDGQLYGITGGGIASNLLSIPTDGTPETVLGAVGLKAKNSDGDIAEAPDGTLYATFWDGRDSTDGSAFDKITLDPTTTEGLPFSGPISNGVAGFAYAGDTFYAGSYYDQTIYTVNINTGMSTKVDWTGDAIGTVTGLSSQPVPAPAAVFAGMGLLGLLGLRRRR